MDNRFVLADANGSPPSPPSPGDSGYFTDGNPGTGTPATAPGAHWFHQVGEEIRAVIADANLTPDHTTLTQLRDALRAMGGELPVAALDYPTIATASNKLTVTPSTATAGGKVAVASGTLVALAEEIVSQTTGRIRMVATPTYQSADLDASSTYYLRAVVTAGALVLYVQKGTDGDSIPAGLKGTPGGSSGGGFDSTVFDMLIAKVVTGSAGTSPTVTALANHRILSTTVTYTEVATGGPVTNTLTLNWGRAPNSILIKSMTAPGAGKDSDYDAKTTSESRYAVSFSRSTWQDVSSIGACGITWELRAF